MPIHWSPFVDLVRPAQRILLTTHVRPDPDGLGSMLGMAEVLGALGKEVRMVISSVWPPRYFFLDPDKRIKRFELPGDSYRDAELVMVLDTGTWNQLGDFGAFLKSHPIPRVVIDHHLSQDELGGTRLVDTNAEATGRLVWEAAAALGVKLNERAANHLFAALATDTGWFRHRNTTPATFALAEKLVAAGAQPTRLYEQIYDCSTLPRLHLMGRVLGRLQVVEGGKVAFSYVQKSDYGETGSIPSDTEELVNFTRSIVGVEVGALFMEQPEGGVKVSFRSRELFNVAKLAEQFGGGGHKLASGATLNTSVAEAQAKVLAAIKAAL